MKMKKSNLLFILSICTIVLFTQCKDDDDDPIMLTQDMLDASNDMVESLTGPQNGMDFAHNGTTNPATTTIREIFTENGNVENNIDKGYVVTKRTYAANADGTKGDLLVTFAMIKHEEGYWADSNDWEYFNFPNNDPSVDFNNNPNGILANAMVSGNVHDTNPGCVGCHNLAEGGDQLFSND